MKLKSLLLAFASSFVLASCVGGAPLSSSTQEETSSSASETSESSYTSEASITTEESEESIESTSIVVEGNCIWAVSAGDFQSSSNGYPSPYDVNVTAEDQTSIALHCEDIVFNGGKYPVATIQAKSNSGSIKIKNSLKGALTMRYCRNYVAYGTFEQDMTAVPSFYVTETYGASYSGLDPIEFTPTFDEESKIYTATISFDGYLVIVNESGYAGYAVDLSFTGSAN